MSGMLSPKELCVFITVENEISHFQEMTQGGSENVHLRLELEPTWPGLKPGQNLWSSN